MSFPLLPQQVGSTCKCLELRGIRDDGRRHKLGCWKREPSRDLVATAPKKAGRGAGLPADGLRGVRGEGPAAEERREAALTGAR